MSRKPSLLPKPLSRMSSGGNTPANSEQAGSASTGSVLSSNSPVEIVKLDDERLPVNTSSPSEVEIRCDEPRLTAPFAVVKNNRELNSDINKNAASSSSTKIASRSRKTNVVAAKVPVIESVFFKQSGHVKLGAQRTTKPLGDSAVNVSNVQSEIRRPSTKPTIDDSRPAAEVKKSTSDITGRGIAVQNVITYRNGSNSAYKKIPSQTDVKKRQVLIVPKQSVSDIKLEDSLTENKTTENIIDVVRCTSPSLEIPSSNSEQLLIQNSGDTCLSIKPGESICVDNTTIFKSDIPNETEQCTFDNTKIKPSLLVPKVTDKLINTKAVTNTPRVNDLPKSGRKSTNAFSSRPISGLDVSESQTPAAARPISAPGTSAYGGLAQAQRRLNLSASKSNLKAPVEASSSVSKTALIASGIVRPEINSSAQKITTALPNKFGKLATTSKLAITRTSISNLRQKPNEQKLSVLKPARSVSNIAKKDLALSIAPVRKAVTSKSIDPEKKSSSRPSSLFAEKPNPNHDHHRSSLDLKVTYVEHFQSVNIPLTADDSHAVAIASPSKCVLESSDVCSAMGCAEEAGNSSMIVMTSSKDVTRPSYTSKLPKELKRRQVPRTSSIEANVAAAVRAPSSRDSNSVIIKNNNFCDSIDSPKILPSEANSVPSEPTLTSAREKYNDFDRSVLHEDSLQDVDNLQNVTITNIANAAIGNQHDVLENCGLKCGEENSSSIISTRSSRASLTKEEATDIPVVSSDKLTVEETQSCQSETDCSVLPSYSDSKQNVINSSSSHRFSRRSSFSSSLSSSSSSTSPASKSTDTVVDSASSESLYSNPEPTSARSEPEKKVPTRSIRTLLNGTLIEQPPLSSLPRRPNSITLCSSSAQQSSPRMTSAEESVQTNRNKQVSTSNLDQTQPSAPRPENFKHIQRIENFGRTATIREYFPQASDGGEHHNAQRPMLLSYGTREGLSKGMQDRRPSQEGNLAGQNIFENKHLHNIRRPNSVDNYSSSSTLSASNCGSDKAVSEPRRLLQTNSNWSGFENYKIKPAETNTQSSGNNKSVSNKILTAKSSGNSSFVSSSISAPVIRQSVDEADPDSAARGRYCSAVKSNISDTSLSMAIEDMQTNRQHSLTETVNQSSIDYVNSPKISRLPLKSKLLSSNIRTKTGAFNDRITPQFSGPASTLGIDREMHQKMPQHSYQASSSGSDRVMPPHSYQASSSGSDRVTKGNENKSILHQSSSEFSRSEVYANDMSMIQTNSDQMFMAGQRKNSLNENNSERIQSSSNSASQAIEGKDFTAKVIRRSFPESTIVQPKLVKPYTAASAAGRNSAFSLANAKRNVVNSAQVTVTASSHNLGSTVNKQNSSTERAGGQNPVHNQTTSNNSVKLRVDEFVSNEGNQWITDDGNKFNQMPYQNNNMPNQRADSISSSRIGNPHTSSININLTTANDHLSQKDACNQSQRSSALFMDLKNRTSSEQDPYCLDKSLGQICARDSFFDNYSKQNVQDMASKNMKLNYCSQSPVGPVKCDDNLNFDDLNESVHENTLNNCSGERTYTSDLQTYQNDSITIGVNHSHAICTDKYKVVTRDKTDNNCVDLTTSESEKESIHNRRSSIYAKLVPNGGKASKNDSLVLERLDADGANKEELFVITYESDDIIVLERRGGNGSSLTSSTREIQDSPTDVVDGHRPTTNRKDGMKDVSRPLPDEFSATEVISPELQQRGLPVSESGYDSWKSDGPKDPMNSRSSSHAFPNYPSVTACNLQPQNHGTDFPCDVDFEIPTSKSSDIDSSFVEPGNCDSFIVATSKLENTVVPDECDDETRKESVDFFSGSTVNKPIRVARLSPVHFRSFLKKTPTNARCERINNAIVDSSGCSMAPGSSILSAKGTFSFVDVIKEDAAANKTNPSRDEQFSSKLSSKNRSRTSGDNLDREMNNVGFITNQDSQKDRYCRNDRNERNYCRNESNKNQSSDCDVSSAGRLKSDRQQRQDTYYENVCDDVLESFEANMSDWENF